MYYHRLGLDNLHLGKPQCWRVTRFGLRLPAASIPAPIPSLPPSPPLPFPVLSLSSSLNDLIHSTRKCLFSPPQIYLILSSLMATRVWAGGLRKSSVGCLGWIQRSVTSRSRVRKELIWVGTRVCKSIPWECLSCGASDPAQCPGPAVVAAVASAEKQ